MVVSPALAARSGQSTNVRSSGTSTTPRVSNAAAGVGANPGTRQSAKADGTWKSGFAAAGLIQLNQLSSASPKASRRKSARKIPIRSDAPAATGRCTSSDRVFKGREASIV